MTNLRRILDLSLYLAFCAMLGTGLLLEFKLVPGREGGRGLRALGLTRHEWGDIHFYIGLVILCLVAMHLWLERKWLWHIAARKHVWKIAAGLACGVLVVAAIISLPVGRV